MIRKPKNYESNDCVKLLYISGPDLYTYIFIDRKPKIYDVLNLFIKTPGIYSKENILIEEENGNIKGLILAYPAQKMMLMSKQMLNLIKDMIFISGLVNFIKIIARFKLNLYFPKLENDELFISNLAVFNNFRKQGVAKRLLSAAEEIAVENGLKKLSLYLEIDNSIAKNLYLRYGFTEESKIILPKRYNKHNLFGFYKMVKVLEKNRN